LTPNLTPDNLTIPWDDLTDGLYTQRLLFTQSRCKLKIYKLYDNPRKVINRLIANPITPTNPKPIAETFEIVVNSWLSGFLSKRQTLILCFVNDFKLNMII